MTNKVMRSQLDKDLTKIIGGIDFQKPLKGYYHLITTMAFLEGIFTNLGNAMSLLVISQIIDIIQAEMEKDSEHLNLKDSTLERIRNLKFMDSDTTIKDKIVLVA